MPHFEAYDPEVKPPFKRLAFPGNRFPRLREAESRVLEAYLDDTGRETVDRLRTAVPVGQGEVHGDPRNRSERQRKALSQWKIDAVIDRPGRQEIIELKSRATHTAVGQALAYDVALGERPDEPTTSTPVVAAFRLHPDLSAFARMVHVQTHAVPSADPTQLTRQFQEDVRRTGE